MAHPPKAPSWRVLMLSWREGRRALASHKLRTGLTMLGMFFGVGAVIAMLAIGEGARLQAMERLRRLGAENILVEALPADKLDPAQRELNSPGLGARDLRAALGLLPDCSGTLSLVRELPLQLGRQRTTGPVRGVPGDYLDFFPGLQVEGRRLGPLDERQVARVCILGDAARKALGPEARLGRQVKLGGEWYRVVGVLGEAPALAEGPVRRKETVKDETAGGAEDPVLAWIPLRSMIHRHAPEARDGRVDQVVLRAPHAGRVAEASRLLKAVIQRRHNGAADTRITVPLELIRQQQATQRMFNLVMGAIAAISLVVGGIGIMNIMLSSVVERTREIGVRRALGATAAEVELQFLVEALLISVGGGLAGIVMGLALAWGISLLAEWPTQVSLWSVLLAFSVSACAGLVFGLVPARRAARLDPIVALRHE